MDVLLQASPWLIVPAIFFARVADVSLGTVRTILTFRGRAVLASLIGFGEVLIWLAAAIQVIHDLSRWYLGLAYAGGFAVGNWVGVWIERKLAIGRELVRILSFDPEVRVAEHLRERGVEVVELPGKAAGGRPVEVLFAVERRRRVPGLVREVRRLDPEAVVTVADVKHHEPGANAAASDAPLVRRLRSAKRK